MKPTWNHPHLGTFTHDGELGWVGVGELPAFDIFTWETEDEPPNGKYEVMFDSEDAIEPSPSVATLAASVIANQQQLAQLVIQALWDDFDGRGPKSGMCWSGDMKQVAEVFGYDDRTAPKGPDDLLSAMRFTGVTVREEIHDYEGPVAELTFAAVFEEEHGIGILTDGSKIIGTGYSCDVTPFESE
jgi:hypothetical protein